MVFLDCGNIDRMPVDFLQRDGIHILNIDHHHDNTRFGTVNLVVPDASCTAEIVLRPGARARGGDHARDRRRPLRRASSPTPASSCTRTPRRRAHRMAADLIEAGVDTARGLPPALRGPSLPPPRSCSPARSQSVGALRRRRAHARASLDARRLRGRRARSRPTRRGSSTTCARWRAPRSRCWCASCSPTTAAAAQGEPARHRRHASTCRAIARSLGGGGHRQAAGFTTELAARRARSSILRAAGRRAADV